MNSISGGDSLAIVAITTAGDTLTLSDEKITTGQMERHTSLAPVAGQIVRLAFRHHATVPPTLLILSGATVDYLQGIEGIDNSNVRIGITGNSLSVYNPDGDAIVVYDNTGRQLVAYNVPTFNCQLSNPGVYLVKVGDRPARKVVVVK